MLRSGFVTGVLLLGLGLCGCGAGPASDKGTPMADGQSPSRLALEAMEPPARQLAQRVIEFAGGHAAIDGIRTLEMRFEVESDVQPIVIHLAWSRSGAAWYEMTLGGELNKSGVNSRYLWSEMNGQRAEKFEIPADAPLSMQDEAEMIRGFAAIALNVINPTRSHNPNDGPMVSLGRSEFKGQAADVLSLAQEPEPGEPMQRMFFDPNTGQPLGTIDGLPSEPFSIAFSEWREVEGGNGLKLFHRVTAAGFWLGNEVVQLKATILRVNTLEEADFEPPADAALQEDAAQMEEF